MFKDGTEILFQEPTSETRLLRRSVVMASGNDSFTIRFTGEPLALEEDQEVLMYFNGKHEFMQQVAQVRSIAETEEEGLLIELAPIGDAISAESRGHYRVSTISANLAATVGGEQGLPVQDLSSTGFAVLGDAEYQLGQTVEVEVAHEEEACHGKASVQSIRHMASGRIRYGLRAIADDPHTDQFLEVLQRISLSVQRDQLQRSGGNIA